MLKLRRNRAKMPDLDIDSSLDLTDAEIQKGAKGFEDWHWGNKSNRVKDWNDDDIPADILVECGRLIRLHVRAPQSNRHPRRRRDTMIELSRSESAHSHVAFDPSHPNQRLYLLVSPRARKAIQNRFWSDNNLRAMPLSQAAMLAGGKHSRGQYPNIMVKPIGVCTAVVYLTDKKGDNMSFYIHQMGEITHYYPLICVDSQGRLWLAGGNYTSPTAGITD